MLSLNMDGALSIDHRLSVIMSVAYIRLPLHQFRRMSGERMSPAESRGRASVGLKKHCKNLYKLFTLIYFVRHRPIWRIRDFQF